MWQRSALNEKEMELLELREQHARLVVRHWLHMNFILCRCMRHRRFLS